jgi:membrane protein DedA with SNARE-associated domain
MWNVAGWEDLFQCLALFAATFLQEDVALVVGAASIVEGGVPGGLAIASLYGGVVVGDIVFYALGSFAHRVPYLRRVCVGGRVELAHRWLERYLFAIVGMCRVTPGLLFPVFVACGWYRVPFARFFIAELITSAVYCAVVLTALIHFGGSLIDSWSYWAWFALGAAVFALGALRTTQSGWGLLARLSSRRERTARSEPAVSHGGMPAIGALSRAASVAERLPAVLFYIPLVVQWFWLALRHRSLTLPTAANPLFEAGGFMGESKSACMRLAGKPARKWIAPFVTFRRPKSDDAAPEALTAALATAAAADIAFPMVAKPDVGWRGMGVRLVSNESGLLRYVRAFPPGEKLILQRYVPYDGEAGVFYVRWPGKLQGEVLSMTFRYFPHVVGDGRTDLARLILRDPRTRWKSTAHLGSDKAHEGLSGAALNAVPADGEVVRLSLVGSNRVGGLYRDAARYVTPALTARFDEIARAIPEFHFGRFDVRFRSLESLQAGEDLQIVEINGAGSEIIHVWDPDVPLLEAYRSLFRQQSILFGIGAANRARGFKPTGAQEFLGYMRFQRRMLAQTPASS